MADFAVPVTSFPIYYPFLTHTLQYTMNKNLLVVKKEKKT